MNRCIFLCLLFLGVLMAGPGAAQQAGQYSRVKVITGKDGLSLLAKAGIAVDHGSHKRGAWFITDLSRAEIDLVKQTGLSYTVLIDDVSSYYRERNTQPAAEKPTAGAGCIECETFETPLNFRLGSMGGFPTYQQFLDALDSMHARYPALITARQPLSSATTLQGRPLYYVKISDNPTQAETEPQVLYTALHHAREPESLAQLIFYMWYLLENYESDAHVKYLVDHTELYFIPCVNPDGYIYNQTTDPGGGGLWRKNRRNNGGSFGVDLNRNYGKFWGYDNEGSSPNGNNDTYRGPAAFSEPETQMIRDFCNSHQFRIALNAHTFSNLLIYPYGHVPALETADSMTFRQFAHEMAACSGFLTGTGDQTVGYVTNGDSDDWMYDEQSSKPKIFSLTPEAGDQSDGFWPVTQRIIPIAKQTLDQNLAAARLATAYGAVEDADDPVIAGESSVVHVNFKRLGLENGTFTVSLVPVSANIATVGAPLVFTAPQHLQTLSGTIALQLNAGLAGGSPVQYIIRWENNTGYREDLLVSRMYGNAELIFYSDGNTLDSFQSQGGWGISTVQPFTPTGSLTDSPNGLYGTNIQTSATFKGELDLTEAAGAYLSYQARWDIEKGYDYVTIAASEDGSSYTPLCGRYTHRGTGEQDDAPAVYDGRQQEWVKEVIDLGDYTGKKIRLRFTLKSDGGVEKDGFFADELAVYRIKAGAVSGIDGRSADAYGLQSLPNPCRTATQIRYTLPQDAGQCRLLITDKLGRVLLQRALPAATGQISLDVAGWASGIYFYRIVSEHGSGSAVRKMVVEGK